MTLKECFKVLELPNGADLGEVKSAYRKLAFSLHPDLNPDLPGASRRFQELNEAYVILSQTLSSEKTSRAGKANAEEPSSAKAREEARQAYQKAQKGQAAGAQKAGEHTAKERAEHGKNKEEVLKDILNDPFARRVFEDIYSHIRHEAGPQNSRQERSAASPGASRQSTAQAAGHAAGRAADTAGAARPASKRPPSQNASVFGGIKGWLRKQIDDEQVLRLPKEQLIPGARVRLQIQHGLSGEPQTVELTLPPEFIPGKAMRLKGMGRRLGNWHGDLYVRIEPL